MKVWTKERLATCPTEELPNRMGSGYRKKKDETWNAWRQRLLMHIEAGNINLNPKRNKKTSGGKDRYLERSQECLDFLQKEGFDTEEERRRFSKMDYETPALNSVVIDTLIRQKTTAPEDLGGMWGVRLEMSKWVAGTWSLKVEEASCPLNCFDCPSARALSCATTNLTSSLEDGFDMRELLLGA
jgi:hypothetical protein